MRFQGRVTQWQDDRGYGFIIPDGGGERIFLHVRALVSQQPRPADGAIVTYELARDAQGRPRAAAVRGLGRQGEKSTVSGPRARRWPWALTALFFAGLGAAVLAGRAPAALPAFYAAISLIAFAAYAIDKSAARNGTWRTPEKTLHLLALAGGWPGALLAQQLLRHKSAKGSFLAVFWATVIVNGGLLGYLLTPGGSPLLHRLLDQF
ncbi:MAG TPA: DUF1294 domain-containing protein [Azonexus sp.]